MSQGFRLKNANETRIYFLEEIDQNELIIKGTERFVQL